MILHPFIQAFISMKWQNSKRFHFLRLLVHVVFIIFITLLAYDYSQNNICVEILEDGSDRDRITILHDATINCNKSDLAEYEETICNYKNKYNSILGQGHDRFTLEHFITFSNFNCSESV